MASAKKFVFEIAAEYQGDKDLQKLKNDLDAIGQVDAFNKLTEQWQQTNTAFVEAKNKARELRTELKNSFDSSISAQVEKTNDSVKRLSGTYDKQHTKLGLLNREVALAATAYSDFSNSLKGGGTDDEVQQLSKLEAALEKSRIAYKKQELAVKTTAEKMDKAKTKVAELGAALEKSVDPKIARQYAAATKEVKALGASLAKQKTAINGGSSALQKQGVKISNLSTEYSKLKTAAEGQGRILAAQNTLGVRSFKEVETEIKGLKSAYATLKSSGTLSVKALAKAQDQLKTKTAALKQETNGWTSHFGRIQQGWVGLAGVIGAGYGFTSMVSNVSRSQKELENFAHTAGMSADQFDDYVFAVQSVGIEQDKLADISKDVKDKLGDFIETGGGEFKDFFENVGSKVGLTAEELIKLSGPDALVAVKKAMDDANISAENQVFYLEALANDASLLLPLLEQEGRLLKEKAAAGKELTDAVSDMDREAVAGVTESIVEMKTAFSTLATDVVAKLAPAITAITGSLTSLALAVADLPAPVVQVGVVVGGMISSFATWHLGLKHVFSALKMGGLDLATTFATKVAPSLASSFTLSLGPLGLLTAALAAGFAVGTWLNQFDIVEKAGIALSAGLTKGFLKIKQAWAWISGGDTEAVRREIEEADRIYSEMFANVGKDSEAAAAAVKKSQGEMATGAESSAAKQQQANKKATDEMKKQYQDYVAEVKNLQDEIAGRELSLAEQLRSISREGMTDSAAYQDLIKEAEEYEAAAKQAAKAGDYSKAVELMDKAADKVASLSKEVKDGDTVLISSAESIKDRTALLSRFSEETKAILQQQQQVVAEAAQALDVESGFSLSDEFGQVSTAVDAVATSIADVQIKTAAYGQTIEKVGETWVGVHKENQDKGLAALNELQRKINEMDGQSINVIANVTQAKAAGGTIQALATGGVSGWRDISAGARLPGWGGGDKVQLLGEPGEVMINKHASQAAGYKAALAFNAQRWDIVMDELTKRFGNILPRLQQGGALLPRFTIPKLPSIQALQAGGTLLAGATAGELTGETVNINFSFAGGNSVGPFQGTRAQIRALDRERQKMEFGSS